MLPAANIWLKLRIYRTLCICHPVHNDIQEYGGPISLPGRAPVHLLPATELTWLKHWLVVMRVKHSCYTHLTWMFVIDSG
jgi:hypothetical protein